MIVEQQQLEKEKTEGTENKEFNTEASVETINNRPNESEVADTQGETDSFKEYVEGNTEIHDREILNEVNIEEENKGKKTTKFIIALNIIIILLLLFICYKIITFGLNSVTAWEVEGIELTEENLQIQNDTKLNIFGVKDSNRRKKNSSNVEWYI